MGKTLIIKGADFSANAVISNIKYNTVDTFIPTTHVSYSWIYIDPDAVSALGIVGKPINTIKFYCEEEISEIKIRKYSSIGNRDTDEVPVPSDFTELQSFSAVQGINTFVLDQPVVLAQGETLGIQGIKNKIGYIISEHTSSYVDSNGVAIARSDLWYNLKCKFPIEFGYMVSNT